jgi:3-dehydroquinate dehydratase/shikimate dehydrogenase
VTLPDLDRICVVIGRTRHGMMLAELQEAVKQGARFIELRLDFLKKAPDFKRLLANKPCTLLATVRRPPDGGKWDQGEEARLMLLRQAIVAGFDWVDLETDIADRIPRFGPVRRIISYHNFREMPADLEKIHQRMCAQDGDVVKLVVRAQHPADNLRVLALIRNAPKPTVAFCIGEMGFPSRILQARYGAPFTYACFNKERNIAPGMPSFAEIRKIYHYEQIGPETRVFGVIGDPVGHSLSPLIHNTAFRQLGMDAVYLPFRVPRDLLNDFLNAFQELPVEGYSVTIPHKEEAARLARHHDETVERTKAANTLVRDDKEFLAYNTDYEGCIDTLKTFLPTFSKPTDAEGPPSVSPLDITSNLNLPAGALTTSRSAAGLNPAAITSAPGSSIVTAPTTSPSPEPVGNPISGRVALVLGAGGVARAVAFALQREGALVTVTNRTLQRAEALASEVGCRCVEWNARHNVLCDLVVNCTSVGMHPNVDESPLHHSFLKPGLVVFDTVYTPEKTLLIREAAERGCHLITGVELFIRQAALQFQHFTGKSAPIDLFRKIIRRALSPVQLREEQA